MWFIPRQVLLGLQPKVWVRSILTRAQVPLKTMGLTSVCLGFHCNGTRPVKACISPPKDHKGSKDVIHVWRLTLYSATNAKIIKPFINICLIKGPHNFGWKFYNWRGKSIACGYFHYGTRSLHSSPQLTALTSSQEPLTHSFVWCEWRSKLIPVGTALTMNRSLPLRQL